MHPSSNFTHFINPVTNPTEKGKCQQKNVETKASKIPVTLGAAYNFTAHNSWTDRFKVCQGQSC